MEDLQGGTLALEHRYDLDRRDGEYALVSVYRGVQHPFERPVWIKVCEAPHSCSAPEVYERLKKSIVRAAEFENDRVLTVADFGDIDKHLAFWVTERRESTALSDYLERHGTLPPAEALEIALRVAEVLQAAHDEEFIHGGIAPRWVSVTDDGVNLDHFAIQPTMHELRALGDVIMSDDVLWSLPPEAFADGETPHSVVSDVWALGALLYWMLSGVHPYLDDPTDTSEAMLRLRAGAPPPILEDLGFDAELSAFVEKALAPDPENRFPNLRAFTKAAPRKDEEPTPAPMPMPAASAELPIESPRQGGVGTAFAVALGLLLLTNLGWFFYNTKQEPEAARAQVAVGTPEILPVGVELATEPAGATIFRIDGASEVEFGDAPITLDPKALPEGQLPLIVRKNGHRDVRLDVTADGEGHRVTLHLPPASEKPAPPKE